MVISARPAFAQSPALPVIPANSFNVTNFGAIGDGVTTNTTAIQHTINAAFAAGGGTVEIPSGVFLSGPLNFSNSINLQLDSGAVLRALPYGSYPGGTSPLDFITSASGAHDQEVSGTGTIDGQATFMGWWGHGLSTSERPVLFSFSRCNRVLIQNVTLENSPSMHIIFKSSNSNITIQGITINTSGSSPNTDGIDLIGTTCVVKDCSISDGDDCIALGSTGGTSSGTLVTNCTFGFGHGMSIGGNTSGGVSNLVVVNCTFNGTQYGIRLKSDNATTSGGEGGLAQNLFYSNLSMTNIAVAAIVIYSYYNEFGTPTGITPATAAGQAIPSPVPSTTCVWRNIVFSNITAAVKSGGIAGIIWGRTEMPVTNVVFTGMKITAPTTFNVYNISGFQFVDSQITLTGGGPTFALFNAGVTLTNDTPSARANVMLTAYSTNNTLPFALYNNPASTTVTDLFAANPITISGGTLTVSNNFLPPDQDVFNFVLGTNASTVTVDGSLMFSDAMINVTNAAGFGPGTYTLFTYTGSVSGTYALGNVPANFNCALTNTTGQIQLVVNTTGASQSPVSLVYSNSSGGLEISWPQDHIGWALEIQTNGLSAGLGSNWTVVPGSATTNVFTLPVVLTNESVFLRLVFP